MGRIYWTLARHWSIWVWSWWVDEVRNNGAGARCAPVMASLSLSAKGSYRRPQSDDLARIKLQRWTMTFDRWSLTADWPSARRTQQMALQHAPIVVAVPISRVTCLIYGGLSSPPPNISNISDGLQQRCCPATTTTATPGGHRRN